MKCPKCRYISFDYNERCPKCNKDLTAEHKKLNIVAFKHNPPFLLAALTDDIQVDLDAISSSDAADIAREDLEMHLDTEILSETEAGEEIPLDLQDSGDLADGMTESDESALGSIGGKTQDTVQSGAGSLGEEHLEMHLETETPEEQTGPISPNHVSSLDPQEREAESGAEELSPAQFEEKDKQTVLKQEEAPDEDLSLDLRDLVVEVNDSDISAAESPKGKTQDTLDLGDLSLEESVPEAQAAPEKAPSESAEIITSEIDKEKLRVSKAQDDAEVELDMEELEELEDESS
jgi:hypothetical protein